MSKLETRKVDADEADIRLDRWFKRHFPALTHGQLQKMLRTGQVRVDGKRAEASTRLAADQEIRVPPTALVEGGAGKPSPQKSARDANEIGRAHV